MSGWSWMIVAAIMQRVPVDSGHITWGTGRGGRDVMARRRHLLFPILYFVDCNFTQPKHVLCPGTRRPSAGDWQDSATPRESPGRLVGRQVEYQSSLSTSMISSYSSWWALYERGLSAREVTPQEPGLRFARHGFEWAGKSKTVVGLNCILFSAIIPIASVA